MHSAINIFCRGIEDSQENDRDHVDAQADMYETEQARGGGVRGLSRLPGPRWSPLSTAFSPPGLTDPKYDAARHRLKVVVVQKKQTGKEGQRY